MENMFTSNLNNVFCQIDCKVVNILCGNLGGLSLMSVRVMLMVVEPERPPTWPAMSLAWITTVQCSLASRSMLAKAVLMIPARSEEKKTKKNIMSQNAGRHCHVPMWLQTFFERNIGHVMGWGNYYSKKKHNPCEIYWLLSRCYCRFPKIFPSQTS